MPDRQQTVTAPASVTVTFDIDEFATRYFPDEDLPADGSFRNQIVSRVSARIAEQIGDDIRSAVSEQIKAQVADIVTQTLTAGIRKTNTWGEPVGEATTLRDQIQREANDWMTKASRDYGNRQTAFQKFLADAVDRQLRSELSKTVEQAKAEVKARVKDQAAQVITDTISRAAGVR